MDSETELVLSGRDRRSGPDVVGIDDEEGQSGSHASPPRRRSTPSSKGSRGSAAKVARANSGEFKPMADMDSETELVLSGRERRSGPDVVGIDDAESESEEDEEDQFPRRDASSKDVSFSKNDSSRSKKGASGGFKPMPDFASSSVMILTGAEPRTGPDAVGLDESAKS